MQLEGVHHQPVLVSNVNLIQQIFVPQALGKQGKAVGVSPSAPSLDVPAHLSRPPTFPHILTSRFVIRCAQILLPGSFRMILTPLQVGLFSLLSQGASITPGPCAAASTGLSTAWTFSLEP